MALWLQENLEAPAKELMEVGDGTLNLLLSWGTPRVVFCTHMDTVPPYIAPKFPEGIYLSKTSLRDPSHPNGWAPPTFEGGAAPLLSPCCSQPSMSLAGHGLRRRSAERESAPSVIPSERSESSVSQYWYFRIAADRFLRNMERATVGTLIEVGRGKHKPEWVAELIASGTRGDAGESVPGHALFLNKVLY